MSAQPNQVAVLIRDAVPRRRVPDGSYFVKEEDGELWVWRGETAWYPYPLAPDDATVPVSERRLVGRFSRGSPHWAAMEMLRLAVMAVDSIDCFMPAEERVVYQGVER